MKKWSHLYGLSPPMVWGNSEHRMVFYYSEMSYNSSYTECLNIKEKQIGVSTFSLYNNNVCNK